MHYGISVDGQVRHMECSPIEIDDKCETLGGVLVTQAETFEQYQRRREQDITGKVDTW